MNSKELRELFSETVCDEEFARHDFETQRVAVREFRRAQWRKKLAGIARIAAVFAMAFVSFLIAGKTKELKKEAALPARFSSARMPPATPKAGQSGLMSDEQLLALFPPGSCYLAEVEGRKMLVFRDEKVKQRFFD